MKHYLNDTNNLPGESWNVIDELPKNYWLPILIGTAGIFAVLVLLLGGCAYSYTIDQYANAIYKAENSKTHPYGIMIKCHDQRAVCKRTVLHKYHNWIKEGKRGLFIHYLASKYAPINCINDNGTNRFWEKNVLYFLTLNK